MKNKKRTNTIINIILGVSLAVVLLVYPRLPDIIPTHWGIDGQVDGTGPKWMVFILWVAAVFVNFLMLYAEKIDPKGENYAKFPKVFNIFRIFITALLCGMLMITIVLTFDPDFINMNTLMYPCMGLMFIVLGNYMPKVKHNYTFGIKTPWTLASENVWNKTHRMAGPVWVLGGAVIALGAFIPANISFVLMMVVTFAVVIIPMVYAYLEFKKEKENDNEKDN